MSPRLVIGIVLAIAVATALGVALESRVLSAPSCERTTTTDRFGGQSVPRPTCRYGRVP